MVCVRYDRILAFFAKKIKKLTSAALLQHLPEELFIQLRE
ncbi:hypothetical protein HMPREF9069_00302 [Atopobium sp. oral taxon 810 str. F0209]|nr:hypothetical protein HMPREF9069_00302 [Atopobium sp. oral taxon 810 str. F0209]